MAERIGGLAGSGAWAYLARSLLHGAGPPGLRLPAPTGPLVLVRSSLDDLEDVADAWEALACLFKGSLPPPAFMGEEEDGRQAGLERLRRGARLVLATPEALAAPADSPEGFAAAAVTLKSGAPSPRSEVMGRLDAAGYHRVDFAENPGEFAVRGAVLDFYGLEPARAVRVLYDEDTVVSLRTFDPATQATKDFLEEAVAIPARPAAAGRVSDWLGMGSLWIVERGCDAPSPGGAARAEAGTASEAGAGDFGARPHPPHGGEPARAWDNLAPLARQGWRVLVYSPSRGEDARIQEMLAEKLPEGSCQYLVGALRQGFLHPGLKLAVVSTAEVFGRPHVVSRRWLAPAAARAPLRLAQLRRGDFVVHRDYGVARFEGLETVSARGCGVTDCLRLRFRGRDTVFVAMGEFGLVQRHSGEEGRRPRLAALDSKRWGEVRARVREGVRELAEKLLRLEARRRAAGGFSFPPSGPMERQFAESFPYEETEDQARAIAEVLADMESPGPMDRVVVGDVGFGKTEVALRAAFRCASHFKQTAVLAPTTILAEQHFRTFRDRLAAYPVRVGVLTRFQTPAQQNRTLSDLARGTLDVVVGTARLLQRDVRFKDLGLTVIDEEHRFGVQDKEKLKHLRSGVDCLALSATPIPRTLSQALGGMRGLSMIQSPPRGRQSIETRVAPWTAAAVAAAIDGELARGGQVYYVHNRVRTLGECVARLEALLPRARIAAVHGRMGGRAIEDVMVRFLRREADILVASTIIESGLDIPSVNTLLIENAHEFGLAQIYQLRGRIGRESRKAHCWLFLPEGARDLTSLDEAGRARLEAMEDLSELGSGLRLALRDLEIRGAGEILGARQHGFLCEVGAELYAELLEEELARLRGSPAPERREVRLDLDVEAFIPPEYLPGESERLEFYKRVLRSSAAERDGLRGELADLCGDPPKPVENLFGLMRLRDQALAAGVKSAVQRGDALSLTFTPDAPVRHDIVDRLLSEHPGRVRFLRSEEGDGVEVSIAGKPAFGWLAWFLDRLGTPKKNDTISP